MAARKGCTLAHQTGPKNEQIPRGKYRPHSHETRVRLPIHHHSPRQAADDGNYSPARNRVHHNRKRQPAVSRYTKILQKHVARENIAVGEILDRAPVVKYGRMCGAARGFPDIDIKRNHPPLYIGMFDDYMIIFYSDCF